MPALREPVFKIFYNGKSITEDLSRFLLSVTYIDKVVGESDEIEIQLEDTDGRWRESWYPEKGDKIKLQMGYKDFVVDCGEFEVDEIRMSGPPDIVTIRGMAAWVTSAMRTKDSYAHENTTLKQIAEYVAKKHGLTLQGQIYTIRIARNTQDQETDLAYLARISKEYGYVFSIRGNLLIFTSVYELEDGKPVKEIDRTDLIDYDLLDKTSETFSAAVCSYHDPNTNSTVEYTYETVVNADNVAFKKIVKTDKLLIKTKAENKQQAEAKAKAALHEVNGKQKQASISVSGDPLLVAGNNYDFTGMGNMSGRYHITQSTHNETKSDGYKTSMESKMVGFISKVKNKPKKPRKKPSYHLEIIQ